MTARRGVCLLSLWLLSGALLCPAPPPDDAEALELVRRAGAAFSIEENYQKALDLLRQAGETAQSNAVKGRVLVETAHVRWMRLESPTVIRELLRQASMLIGPPGEEYKHLPEHFRKLWRQAFQGKVRTEAYKKRFFMDFHFEVLATGLASADANFADAYGRFNFMPEARLAIAFYKGWQLWAGYSSFSFQSVLPVIDVELEGFQRFITLGLAWEHDIGKRMAFNLGGGLEWVSFEERASMERVQDKCVGLRVRADLKWRVSSGFYLLASLGYGMARKEIAGRTFRPGGLRLGTGLGLRF